MSESEKKDYTEHNRIVFRDEARAFRRALAMFDDENEAVKALAKIRDIHIKFDFEGIEELNNDNPGNIFAFQNSYSPTVECNKTDGSKLSIEETHVIEDLVALAMSDVVTYIIKSQRIEGMWSEEWKGSHIPTDEEIA